jgi:hypothetical protein
VWHADWQSSEIDLLDGVQLLESRVTTLDPPAFAWAKAQLFFLMRPDVLLDAIRDQVDQQLAEAVRRNRPQEIIGAINNYMSYGTVLGSTDLTLWTDLRVERRDERAHGQIALADVPTQQFALRRSQAVMNHPSPTMRQPGTRTFLVYTGSPPSSLLLSPATLHLLRTGRSHRTVDRPHTDIEWDLSRFFAGIAASAAGPDRLDVLEVDFSEMRGAVRTYRLDLVAGQVEPRGAL